jgi:hypothetical protein
VADAARSRPVDSGRPRVAGAVARNLAIAQAQPLVRLRGGRQESRVRSVETPHGGSRRLDVGPDFAVARPLSRQRMSRRVAVA